MKNLNLLMIALMAIMLGFSSCDKDEDEEVKTLTATPTMANFSKDGGISMISITSNTSWTATSGAPWCTVTPTSGSGSATVVINAIANSGDARNAMVTIMGTGVVSPPVSIALSQASGNNALVGTSWKALNRSSFSFTTDTSGIYNFDTDLDDLYSFTYTYNPPNIFIEQEGSSYIGTINGSSMVLGGDTYIKQ